MSLQNEQNKLWYVYVLLCEGRTLFSGITTNLERKLKEQFSGYKSSSPFLREHKPLLTLKKFKCKSKGVANKASKKINSLKNDLKENYIISSLFKKQKPLDVTNISKNNFTVICPECSFKSIVNCKQSNVEIDLLTFKCIHEVIKEKIDGLFEQALLGAVCFNNGRFMFEGRNDDRARDFLLDFSGLDHRKRTMAAYETLDEISFKNSYLLLSAVLEEVYYEVKKYSDWNLTINLPADYRQFSFNKRQNGILKDRNKIRFSRIAHFVRQVGNVLKHDGGIINNGPSSKSLIKDFKLKKDWDIVAGRCFLNIEGISIGDIYSIIIRLYVFYTDLIASLFRFQRFRIKSTKYDVIQKEIVNYEIRESFIYFLKEVQKDGSVLFMNI